MTYREFWLIYLRAHSRLGTRVLHYVGSVLALILLGASAIMLDWRLLIAAIVVGYGCAWIGHVVIERNRPATFGHPIWSLLSDYRMVTLWAVGQLGVHLAEAKREAGPVR